MKLLLFTVVAIWVAESCPSSLPCPRTKVSLNKGQIAQIRASEALIGRLQRKPDLLYDTQYQKPIVTLTARQEFQLLKQYPLLFQKSGKAEFISPVRPTAFYPPHGSRGRRETDGRICQPSLASTPLVLARQPNGDIVQLAHCSLQNRNQWILEEMCLTDTSTVSGVTVACGLAERIIPALFINLSGIQQNGGSDEDFDLSYITLRHCVAYTI